MAVTDKMQRALDCMFDEEEGCWFDLERTKDKHGQECLAPRKSYYPSNLTPLFTGTYSNQFNNEKTILRMVDYAKVSIYLN